MTMAHQLTSDKPRDLGDTLTVIAADSSRCLDRRSARRVVCLRGVGHLLAAIWAAGSALEGDWLGTRVRRARAQGFLLPRGLDQEPAA